MAQLTVRYSANNLTLSMSHYAQFQTIEFSPNEYIPYKGIGYVKIIKLEKQILTVKLNMSLSELISRMYDSNAPLDTFRALKEANYKPTPTKAQFKQTLNSFADALKQNKVRKALSIARALLLTSP